MAHVSDAKKQSVIEFKKILAQYPIVGLVNMENLPTAQLNNMRTQLRAEGVVIKMTKKRVLKIILQEMESQKPGISGLIAQLKGMPALLFAKESPFKIYKKIQAKKSPAPAKGGQIAPRDIVIQAGPTPFAPGPIIGELGAFKIKAGIENAKVVIKQDATVVRKGEVISPGLAAILTRLAIQPMEIGLDVVSMFEAGIVYTTDVLAVDDKQYLANLMTAHTHAFNLAIECSIYTAETTEFMITKAVREAKAVAIEFAIVSADTIGELLAKGQAHAQTLEQSTHK